MSYGNLNAAQKELLQPVVEGKTVLDLGAGGCELSRVILDLGAPKVIAVDSGSAYTPHPKIEFHRAYFERFLQQIAAPRYDVGFLSWPINHFLPALIPILGRCDRVVFLGTNTDGTMCGWVGLYEYLLTRRLDGYEPDRKNSLVIYGPPSKEPRVPVGVEWAGLDDDTMFTFEQAERQPSGSSERFPALFG